ncbi:hypothetical protein GH714_003412 [Hevea brasiliensis]|uniref:Uncharacterized protein n=1 Tax=Hevea brasiliensis TaxID=3981 RepID=A0A6A6KIH9_HEVBR|nr:hypothetical protein GH714_003412 [Hevea brasiliensis]
MRLVTSTERPEIPPSLQFFSLAPSSLSVAPSAMAVPFYSMPVQTSGFIFILSLLWLAKRGREKNLKLLCNIFGEKMQMILSKAFNTIQKAMLLTCSRGDIVFDHCWSRANVTANLEGTVAWYIIAVPYLRKLIFLQFLELQR